MRAGPIASTLGHVAVILWAVVSLPGSRPPADQFVDSMPVELVDIGEVTDLKLGDKKAAKSEALQSSPVPSKLPEAKPVEKPGEATRDLDSPPTPTPSQTASAPPPPTAAPPPPAETPAEPDPAPAETPPPPKPAAAPAEPEPAPATPPPPEAAAEEPAPPPPEAEPKPAEAAPAPEATPPPIPTKLPMKKPPPPPKTPPKTETAKAVDKPPSEDKTKFDSDKIAALLDKQKPSGGGTETPTGPSALGSDQGTATTKLTLGEENLLQAQISRCYNTPAGNAGDTVVKAKIQFAMNPDGSVSGVPEILNSSSDPLFRAIAEAGRRAILRCQPYDLPDAKYDAWNQVIVNFGLEGLVGG